MTQYKGKQELPYLLSTTKTLARCKRYYYRGLDYKFNCKRNRDCYTERNVRINITRMWHNVVVPNAIICRENGQPATYKEALLALNYAMSHGKTKRSLAMWNHVCKAEAELNGSPESIVYKFQRSFYFYALGQAVTKDGLVYNLPKSKVFTIDTYTSDPSIRRFIYKQADMWMCPWDDLNMLVYKWRHYEDDFNAQCDDINEQIAKLNKDLLYAWGDQRTAIEGQIKDLEDKLENLDEPVFPTTQREIVEQFHVSRTSAARFRMWVKQLAKYNNDAYWDKSKLYWSASPKFLKDADVDEEAEESEKDFIDTGSDDDDTGSGPDISIDQVAQSVANSGERPVGRVDDAVMPF